VLASTIASAIAQVVFFTAGGVPRFFTIVLRILPVAGCNHSGYVPRVKLVRFGVAMESDLLDALDRIVGVRNATRSEILRDLVRAEVTRESTRSGAWAVGTLTIVYDHHVRELTKRLTDLQHSLGEHIRSTMHVHLSDDLCLETIVMSGRADELRDLADKILATRGVKQGGLELFTDVPAPKGHTHTHTHPHPHAPHAHAKAR
jgi:CopG family nickel-responsive transcriptional regulator